MPKISAIQNTPRYIIINRNLYPEVFKERQNYVLGLVKQGLNKDGIAKELGLSNTTGLKRIWKLLNIDDAIKEDLLKSKLQGKTREDITKEWNLTQHRYYTMLKRYNIPRTQKGLLILKKDEIMALINQGKSKVEIAQILGVNYQVLYEAMAKMEINTLNKETLQNMKKSDLIKMKKKYGSIFRISKVLNVSFQSINKLFEFFGLK